MSRHASRSQSPSATTRECLLLINCCTLLIPSVHVANRPPSQIKNNIRTWVMAPCTCCVHVRVCGEGGGGGSVPCLCQSLPPPHGLWPPE